MGGEVLNPPGMAAGRLALLVAALAVAACATPPSQAPRGLERLTPDAAAGGAALPQPLSLDETVALTRRGVAPEAILARLREGGWEYRLSPEEEARLAQAGVDRQVLAFMTARQRQEAAERGAARDARRAEHAGHPWSHPHPAWPARRPWPHAGQRPWWPGLHPGW